MIRYDSRILRWEGKHGPVFIYARTPEECRAAYLKLFRHFNEMGFYDYDETEDEAKWYDMALEGDAQAARWLIDSHSGYEYEHVEFEHVLDPFEEGNL